jgi:hypothetical protein
MKTITWLSCPHIADAETQHTENWITTTILQYIEGEQDGIRLCLCEICSSAVLGEITRNIIRTNANVELRKMLKDVDE